MQPATPPTAPPPMPPNAHVYGLPQTMATSDGRPFNPNLPVHQNGTACRIICGQYPIPWRDGQGNTGLADRVVVVCEPGATHADVSAAIGLDGYLRITTGDELKNFIRCQGEYLEAMTALHPGSLHPGNFLHFQRFVHLAAVFVGQTEATESSSSEESRASTSNQ